MNNQIREPTQDYSYYTKATTYKHKKAKVLKQK